MFYKKRIKNQATARWARSYRESRIKKEACPPTFCGVVLTKSEYRAKHNAAKGRGGYVLLFSILISSIILAIGMGIANITTKSLALRSAGSDSQFAFYAADGGAECALLWDLKHPGFTLDTVFATSTFSNPPTSGVMCNKQDIDVTIFSGNANSAETQFTINLSGDTCAKVTVSKTNSGLDTQIISRGYNDDCAGGFVRLLERAIRITF